MVWRLVESSPRMQPFKERLRSERLYSSNQSAAAQPSPPAGISSTGTSSPGRGMPTQAAVASLEAQASPSPQVPQEPPQPSSPHSRLVQSGVTLHTQVPSWHSELPPQPQMAPQPSSAPQVPATQVGSQSYRMLALPGEPSTVPQPMRPRGVTFQ